MNTPAVSGEARSPRLLLCLSHLRWDFVQQRPHHLLTRAAKEYLVVYFEEPEYEAGADPQLRLREAGGGVTIATPVLDGPEASAALPELLAGLLASLPHRELVAWYYTPMALEFTGGVEPDLVVYDCMDELSAFKNPPPGLREREDALLISADVVFTGGYSLFEAKRRRHPQVFAFPSSVDAAHFGQAREGRPDPDDQRRIGRPRIGFFGVIDERMDLDLVARAAETVAEAEFVMLGPVAKIDPDSLPRRPNLHWLGPKRYAELPDYLANWTAGWMPFAINAATRFISPTKTPEFLAAGLPLTSTAVPDVLRGYAGAGLVAIADRASIAERLRASLAPPDPEWTARVDRHLAAQSWDRTWAGMRDHMLRARTAVSADLQKKGA